MVRNRRWTLRLGGWVAFAVSAVALLLAGSRQAAVYGVLVVVISTAGAVLQSVSAVRSRGSTRRVWTMGALGLLLWAVVEVRVGLSAVLGGAAGQRPVWAHVVNLFALVLAVGAMFAMPNAPRTRTVRARMLFDGVAIAAAMVGMAWMFILAPMSRHLGSSLVAMLNLSYPVIAIGVLAIAFVLLAGQHGHGFNALACVSGGVVAITMSVLLELGHDLSGFGWLRPCFHIGLVSAALLLSLAPLTPLPTGRPRIYQPTAISNLLPYLPVGLFVIAMAAFTATGSQLELPVVWAGLAMIGAVLGRQFLALRLTAALSRDLDRQRKRLAHEATHDALTGLPNRVVLMGALAEATGSPALLMIDLDGFKAVNDTLGHPAGDELLVVVADRLHTAAQPFAASVLVTRLGGDEFAVLLRDGGAPVATDLAAGILRAIAEPAELQTRTVAVRASVGIAVRTDPTARPSDLMRDADIALYSAKEQGKGQYRVFDPELSATVNERLRLESDLAHAVEGGQLEVAYQPVVHLQSGAILGAEALVRWRHPEHGLLAPAAFLDAAQDIGLLPEFDRWVLWTACHQLAIWRRLQPHYTIHVNVSAAYLATGTIRTDVVAALAAAGLPGDALTVEVTETTLVADLDRTSRTLSELRELGVRVALDDFGVGYSSLTYLRTLPADVIKIDRSFVRDLDGVDADATLVRTVLTLARNLGMHCVAEGVEGAEHAERLRELECEQAQGFYFARPLPADDMHRLLVAEDPQWTDGMLAGDVAAAAGSPMVVGAR